MTRLGIVRCPNPSAAAALCAVLAAAPGVAETPLDGAAFEALTSGRTLHFDRWGLPYGAEQYLPGRRVIWQFEGEDCLAGRWYPRDDAICFVYDAAPGAVCWSVLDTEAGIRIREQDDVPGNDLTIRKATETPLPCPGPWLGS
jgi:hypothetical protein